MMMLYKKCIRPFAVALCISLTVPILSVLGIHASSDALSPVGHSPIGAAGTTNTRTSVQNTAKNFKSFDKRSTISRSEAKAIYDKFATEGHIGGNDAGSGYGGPAVQALMSMANFGQRQIDSNSPRNDGGRVNNEDDGSKTDCSKSLDKIVSIEDSSSSNSYIEEKNNEEAIVQRVFEYGCGSGKLAEHVLHTLFNEESSDAVGHSINVGEENETTLPSSNRKIGIHWHGVDQSPEMITKFQERMLTAVSKCRHRLPLFSTSSHLLENNDGDPSQLLQITPSNHYHRFVSTYCLDLLSERDMYSILDLAEHCLRPSDGKLFLAGITYGYKDSFPTFCMTLAWEIMYKLRPSVVGGCRPQRLEQYLIERGWIIERMERTMPDGYPWMVSEVICARPPIR